MATRNFILSINSVAWEMYDKTLDFSIFKQGGDIDIHIGVQKITDKVEYLYDPSIPTEETIQEAMNFKILQEECNFIAYDTNGRLSEKKENDKQIDKFTGTFIDAFRFINKHSYILYGERK